MTSLHEFDCRMDYGTWTENSRGTYNKWDGVARSTIQVCEKQCFLIEVSSLIS